VRENSSLKPAVPKTNARVPSIHWRARSYKPQPQTYLKSAKPVGLEPEAVAMVAAHNSDLAAARSNELKTVFIRRPSEHGPGQTSDLVAEQDWDVIVDSLTEAADALDC
jgi:2-haloacid dehalogenase